MKIEDAQRGNLVQVDRLITTAGLLVGPGLIKNRRADARGIVLRGDPANCIVWVKHGGTVAPYWDSELVLIGVVDPEG